MGEQMGNSIYLVTNDPQSALILPAYTLIGVA